MATLGRRSLFSMCQTCNLLMKSTTLNSSRVLSHKRLSYFPHLLSRNTRQFHTSIGPLKHEGRQEWEDPKSDEEIVRIKYIKKDGESVTIEGKVGDNVMYLAHRHEIEIEGACEASLACCTCHVYVSDDFFDKLPEATEKEEDMLDLAPFLRVNSRLSCQITLTKELEGIQVELPQATRNFYVDGHVPAPH